MSIKNLLKWDEYFFNICESVSKNSKCLSRRIGAILVNDHSIISTGYNGPPRGVPHCNERYIIDPVIRSLIQSKGKNPDDKKYHNICPRNVAEFKSGEGLEFCIAGHSERNALNNAARNGIKTKGSLLYMSCGVPCSNCLIEIINAGVDEIIITAMSFYDSSSTYLLKHSKLKVRIFEHLKDKKDSWVY